MNKERKQKQSHKNRKRIYWYWKERRLEMLDKMGEEHQMYMVTIICKASDFVYFVCHCIFSSQQTVGNR